MNHFTFKELWNWNAKLDRPNERRQAIQEALDRGYEFKELLEDSRWELWEKGADGPTVTGHYKVVIP